MARDYGVYAVRRRGPPYGPVVADRDPGAVAADRSASVGSIGVAPTGSARRPASRPPAARSVGACLRVVTAPVGVRRRPPSGRPCHVPGGTGRALAARPEPERDDEDDGAEADDDEAVQTLSRRPRKWFAGSIRSSSIQSRPVV